MSDMLTEIRKNTQNNLNTALNTLEGLNPKDLTKKLANQFKAEFDESTNPFEMLNIAGKMASSTALFKQAQSYIGKTDISEESKTEYKQLVFTAVLSKDPEANVERLETEIDVTLTTCPCQQDMNWAIESVKEKIEEAGLSHCLTTAIN